MFTFAPIMPGTRDTMRADIQEATRALLGEMNRRFDDLTDMNNQRHSDNILWLQRIDEKVAKTNGRVTASESMITGLKAEFDSIRRRWHDFRDSIQDVLHDGGKGDGRAVSQRELALLAGLVVTVATLSVVITLFIVKHG